MQPLAIAVKIPEWIRVKKEVIPLTKASVAYNINMDLIYATFTHIP